jgi:hypothetical protein
MSDIGSHHDRYFRETFSRAEAARDLVTGYLPPEVTGCLDLGTLEVTGDTFVDPELRLHVSDLACRVARRGGGEAYVYVLFEHKSWPDRLVALQLLRYMTRLWGVAVREGQKSPLPAVIPVVFYHGRERWNVAREFRALLDCPEALAPYVPSFRYVLTDLSALSDEEIRGSVLVRTALLAMRHVFDADLPRRLPGIVGLLDTVVRTPSGLGALEALLRYIASAGKGVGEQEVRDAVREAFPEEGDKLMTNFVEKWVEQGVEQGIEQGIEQGVAQGIAQGAVVAAREDLLEVLRARFGAVPAGVTEWVRTQSEVATLRGLLRKAATVASMEAFREAM